MARYGRWQNPVVMHKYPHLLSLDAVCWTRFLEQNVGLMARVQYDTWCGTPITWRDGVNPIPNQSEGCGCKRVDVIFEDQAGGLHIVEVKPYGNYVALGQVLMYGDLLCVECDALRLAQKHIVCFGADPDVLPMAAKQNVLVHEVGYS